MNRLEKLNETSYLLTTEDGQEFKVGTWYEKSKDKTWVKLPKDNPSGREYISTEKFVNTDQIEFETKTSGPRVLTGGGWRSRLTTDELSELTELEVRIEELKNIGMTREVPKVDPNSIEGIELQIKKLTERLNKKNGGK